MPQTAVPITLQLQELSASGDTPISDVVRKARMVATKLDLTEFNEWLGFEMNGYPAGVDVPEYRCIIGDLVLFNHANGRVIPIAGPSDLIDDLSRVTCHDPIGHIEELSQAHEFENAFLRFPLTGRAVEALRRCLDDTARYLAPPFRKVPASHMTMIIDKVRSKILDWSLQLEKQGILGEGMTLNEKEKQAATVFNITNNGPVGSIGNHNSVIVHQGDFESLTQALLSVGIPQTDIDELNDVTRNPPEVAKWMGKIATKVYSGAVTLAGGVSKAVVIQRISQAIETFLGQS